MRLGGYAKTPSLQQITQLTFYHPLPLLSPNLRAHPCGLSAVRQPKAHLSTGFTGLTVCLLHTHQFIFLQCAFFFFFSPSLLESLHAEAHLLCRGWGLKGRERESFKGELMSLHTFRNLLHRSQMLRGVLRML